VRSPRSLLSGFGVLAACMACVQLAGSAAATAQGQAATQRVIVVLKNQETSLPATRGDIASRKRAVQAIQAPVTSQLTSSGARGVHAYTVLNAVAATVSPSEVPQPVGQQGNPRPDHPPRPGADPRVQRVRGRDAW
jgi:hypothetical protein